MRDCDIQLDRVLPAPVDSDCCSKACLMRDCDIQLDRVLPAPVDSDCCSKACLMRDCDNPSCSISDI
jgi:hypothetical protein